MKPHVSCHRDRCASERGAIVIFVAMALVALLAFSAFIVDYGVMWVSRRQAQNVADAAAMAGARSLPIDGGSNAEAILVAKLFASKTDQGAIWGQHPDPDADVMVSGLPFTCPVGAGGGDACIRVDVIRGTVDRVPAPHGNTLPIFFGPLFGLASQGVRATATAQAAPANAVSCIRPWIVADRWLKGTPPPWNQSATFNPPPLGSDSYVPPWQPNMTGFTVADNYGLQLVLKPGVIGAQSAGWTQEIYLGGATTAEQISGCPSFVPTVGIYEPSVDLPCDTFGDAFDPARGCVQVRTGMSFPVTTNGVGNLVGQDPLARWDSSTRTVRSTRAMSPRIVPLAIFDTETYFNESASCGGLGCVARVVNIVGFFVQGMCNSPSVTLDPGITCPTPSEDVVGRLMNYPAAEILPALAAVTPAASFLTVTRLVR